MMDARRTALVAAGALLLVGTGCGARTDAPDVPDVGADPTVGTTSQTPAEPQTGRIPRARRARAVVVAEPPLRATLPSGRDVRIRAVGTTDAGLLDVPADIGQAGWWRGGSQLGDPFGSTLVAAHVDSRTQGLGPFAELLELAPGARIRLRSAHLAQTFAVRSRRLVPQGSLTEVPWLFDVSGQRRLTLVTCAPPYDASRGGYQNLAVVIAVPVFPAGRP